jgi:hypothetical protein
MTSPSRYINFGTAVTILTQPAERGCFGGPVRWSDGTQVEAVLGDDASSMGVNPWMTYAYPSFRSADLGGTLPAYLSPESNQPSGNNCGSPSKPQFVPSESALFCRGGRVAMRLAQVAVHTFTLDINKIIRRHRLHRKTKVKGTQ